MNPAVRAFDLHPPPVSAARTSAFGWVIALSEASKKLVTHSFQVNLLALAAIVQSRRAGQSLRGFDEVASQMRRWSVDLHTELEKLRGIGREAVSLASQLTKAARLVDILERARGTRADTALERALERRRHSVEELASLALWLTVNPELRCYTSWLWCTFIPHFGGASDTFIPVPDEGMRIEVGTVGLTIVPAHFLHSSGNHHLYDPAAKILFSGDVGAALLPEDDTDLYVTDFDHHVRHARGFHQRWMGSREARDSWCERAAKLDIELMCPQHGAIYRGKDVGRFISWFAELPVGVLRAR